MSGSPTKRTLVNVIFSEGGVPAWFGPEPTAGSEPIDLADLHQFASDGVSDPANTAVWRQILITHCRIDGEWLPREISAVTPETGADATGQVGLESDAPGDALIDPVLSQAGTGGQDETEAS